MLSNDYIKSKVIALLPIDSELYADQLDILVGGAVNKLLNEGIDSSTLNEGTNVAFDYCICVAYQVACDMDADVDIARMHNMYISRVNTLRTSLA